MINSKDYNFSFSGLKTAVLYSYKGKNKRAMANEIQNAIIDVLISKTLKAVKNFRPKTVMIAGGVAANRTLRKRLQQECRKNKLNFLSAERKYQTDNGAMIAVAAYINHLKKKSHRITAQGNLNL